MDIAGKLDVAGGIVHILGYSIDIGHIDLVIRQLDMSLRLRIQLCAVITDADMLPIAQMLILDRARHDVVPHDVLAGLARLRGDQPR